LLANDTDVTNDVQVGLTWSPGASDGGAPVQDYDVYYYVEAEGNFVLLVDNLNAQAYTLTGVTSGATYRFVVTARNSVGDSL
jgi:hypothetical protein